MTDSCRYLCAVLLDSVTQAMLRDVKDTQHNNRTGFLKETARTGLRRPAQKPTTKFEITKRQLSNSPCFFFSCCDLSLLHCMLPRARQPLFQQQIQQHPGVVVAKTPQHAAAAAAAGAETGAWPARAAAGGGPVTGRQQCAICSDRGLQFGGHKVCLTCWVSEVPVCSILTQRYAHTQLQQVRCNPSPPKKRPLPPPFIIT